METQILYEIRNDLEYSAAVLIIRDRGTVLYELDGIFEHSDSDAASNFDGDLVKYSYI